MRSAQVSARRASVDMTSGAASLRATAAVTGARPGPSSVIVDNINSRTLACYFRARFDCVRMSRRRHVHVCTGGAVRRGNNRPQRPTRRTQTRSAHSTTSFKQFRMLINRSVSLPRPICQLSNYVCRSDTFPFDRRT